MLALFFLACLVLLVFWLLERYRSPVLRIVCLPLHEFPVLSAAPIEFAESDCQLLEDLCRDEDDYRLIDHPDAQQKRDEFVAHLAQLSSDRVDVLVCPVWGRPLVESERLMLAGTAWEHGFGPDQPDGDQSKHIFFRSILETIANCSAKHKVLVLDAGRIGSACLVGAPVWDLPRLVRKEFKTLDTPHGPIWVLLANSGWEQSHVSPSEQRSYFTHYLSQALHGQADGFGNRPKNGQIDLAEVYQYVQDRVAARVWAASQNARTQTPVLLCSTVVQETDDQQIEEEQTLLRAQQIVLRVLPRKKRTGDQEASPDAEPKADDKDAKADDSEGVSAIQSRGSESGEPDQDGTDKAKDSASPGTGSDSVDSDADSATSSPGKAATDSSQQAEPPSEGEPDRAEAAAKESMSAGQEIENELAILVEINPNLAAIFRQYGEMREYPLADCPDVKGRLAGWTPIDFAPHFVRRFEESAACYRIQAVSVPQSDETTDPTDEVARRMSGDMKYHREQICKLAWKFQLSDTRRSWDVWETIKGILRTRNQAMFELPDYIRMQTQLPGDVLETDFHHRVHDLMEGVDLLTQALEQGVIQRAVSGVPPTRFVASVGPGGRDVDLEEIQAGIIKNREWLLERLGVMPTEARVIPADHLFLSDLMMTSLPGPVLQARFAAHLLTPSAHEDPLADSALRAPSPDDVNAAAQGARRRSLLRAQLELRAWMLTCSDPDERELLAQSLGLLQERLDSTTVISPYEDKLLSDLLVRVDAQIRAHATQIAQRLPWVSGDEADYRTELALRLLPGRIAIPERQQPRPSVPLWAPFRHLTEIPESLVFLPPAAAEDGTIPLNAEGDEFVWKLQSPAGKIPTRLRMILDYSKEQLEVTGEGRPLTGEVDWQIDAQSSPHEYDLKLHIRAKPGQVDGAIASLTITLPDEGGLRASVDFQLPEPTQLRLTIEGPVGTLDGDLQVPSAGTRRKDELAREIEFNASGEARVTLRPYSSSVPTPYLVTARNPSSQQWQVRSTVWAISDQQRQRGGLGFRPWKDSAADRSSWRLLSENDWRLGQGQSAELPLFTRPKAPDPTGESDLQAPVTPASPEPTLVDVTGGLFILLEHAGGQQQLWLDVRPLHPAAYLGLPDVRYDVNDLIRVEVRAANLQILPPGLSSIRWEIPPALRPLLQQIREPGAVDLRANEFTQFGAKCSPNQSLPRSVPITLSADGYPRAFEYDLELSTGSRGNLLTDRTTAQVVLCQLDEQGKLKRDEQQRVLEISPGTGFRDLPHIGVMLRADTPPPERVNSDFRLRVYLQGTAGLTTGRDPGVSKEFFRDRQFFVQLQQAESSPGFNLIGHVDELTAVLQNPFKDDKIIVHWEIESRPYNGSKPVLVEGDDSAYLVHDSRPPQIVNFGAQQIREGQPVNVEVREDSNGIGIAALLYSSALDPAGNLAAPKQVRDPQNTRGLVTLPIPSEDLKPGKNVLYLAATDVAGNTGPPISCQVEVMTTPPKKEVAPPELKEIRGRVVYQGSGERGVTVKLRGPIELDLVSGRNGEFRFGDLLPGQYRISAAGRVRGVSMAAPTQTVVLTDADTKKEVELPLR
jgi:hypothetical protein